MNSIRNVFKSYQKMLYKYPLSTQSVQAGTLMGLGDVIAQTFVEKKSVSNVNVLRTARFASVGLFFAGPGLRTWYLILDRHVGQKGGKVVMKKVILDQFLFAPVFIGALVGLIGLTGGQPIDEVKRKFISDYPDILFTNYYVWPAVQTFNFYMVPLNYQVLTVQIVAIFWNTYLSWKWNKSLEPLHIASGDHPLEKDAVAVPIKSPIIG